MKIAAVIPNSNQRELLRSTLHSLQQQTRRFDYIVVVDNGSSDGSADVAREFGCMLIPAPRPLGFAVAVNWGLTALAADLVVVLNNDLTLDPHWLEHIAQAAEKHPEAGFFTGLLLRPDGLIDGAYDLLSAAGLPWRAGSGMPVTPAYEQERDIRLASFTAVALRQSVLEQVGLLDPAYETYLEDTDFMLRCAAAGVHGRYVPQARGVHLGSKTLGSWSKVSTRLLARNQVFLLAKHFPPDVCRQHAWKIAVGHLLWLLVAFRHGAGWSCLSGYRAGLQSWRKLRPESETPVGNGIAPLMAEQEREILALQGNPARDWLWRWYFRLT